MDKKYQIFVSSTYLDLKEARMEVTKAILDLGHIPSGMELFPASSIAQMDYIKRVIDDCDYYVIILGGRYGSIGPDGLGYTEAEYEYARLKDKPILAFVHEDIGSLKSRDTEVDKDLRARLEAFRAKVQSNRLTKYWSDVSGLQSKVIVALNAEFAATPQVGWRRDDGGLSRDVLSKLEILGRERDRFRDLYYKESTKLRDYENLAESSVEIKYHADLQLHRINVSGEDIIREFAPKLVLGVSKTGIEDGLKNILAHHHSGNLSGFSVSSMSVDNVVLFFEVFEIGKLDDFDDLVILPGKKFLLKAAFRPLKKVIFEDDIPF